MRTFSPSRKSSKPSAFFLRHCSESSSKERTLNFCGTTSFVFSHSPTLSAYSSDTGSARSTLSAFAACGFAVFTHFFFPCIALPESFSSSLLLSASIFSMYSANASDPSSRIFSRISPGPDRKLSTLRYPAALAGTDTSYSFLRSLKFSHVGGMHTSPSKTSANSAESSVFSNMRPRTPTALSPSKHRLTWAVRPWTSTTGMHFPTDPRNTSCPFSSRLMGSRSIRSS